MSTGATVPAGAKFRPGAPRTPVEVRKLVDVLQEIGDGLINVDEGAARLGCSALDLAQLGQPPRKRRGGR